MSMMFIMPHLVRMYTFVVESVLLKEVSDLVTRVKKVVV